MTTNGGTCSATRIANPVGTNMQNIELTQSERQTYLHLGIIAATAGLREGIYKTKRRVQKENPSTGGVDLTGWFAKQFSDEELGYLRLFRHRLFHGFVIVQRDGAVRIFTLHEGELTYTPDEIRQYASRFWSLRFENRVTMTTETYYPCNNQCGQNFPDPESAQAHLEHCSA